MRPRVALACALATALLSAAPAKATERINATFLAEYGSVSYTIDQGEIVTLANEDKYLAHGIASDSGGLFSAPVIGRGRVRLVRGASFLTAAGSPYLFHCPIHAGMTSVLNVTGAGAPLPADTIPPSAKVKVKTRSARRLAAKHQLQVAVTPSEAVDAVIRASAGGIPLGRVERTYVVPGRRSVSIALSPQAASAVARLAGPVTVAVKVALSDVAGLSGKARARRDLAAAGTGSKGGGGRKR